MPHPPAVCPTTQGRPGSGEPTGVFAGAPAACARLCPQPMHPERRSAMRRQTLTTRHVTISANRPLGAEKLWAHDDPRTASTRRRIRRRPRPARARHRGGSRGSAVGARRRVGRAAPGHRDHPHPTSSSSPPTPCSRQLAEMLDVSVTWQRGAYVAAARLQFMRRRVPVFVHGSPDVPRRVRLAQPDRHSLALGRARAMSPSTARLCSRPRLSGSCCSPWCSGTSRAQTAIGDHLRTHGHDGRLLIRIMREGHVGTETEEAVWKHLER